MPRQPLVPSLLLCLTLIDPPPRQQVAVTFQPDEADAALAILRARSPSSGDWARLFTSQGYLALQRRESAMGRAFTNEDFRAFLQSDSLRLRTSALARTLREWKQLDVHAAAGRALAYLPAGTRLKATLFLEIKPRTNSFVFDIYGVRAIFLYVDPTVSAAELEGTIAHELHHVGMAAACTSTDSTLPAGVRAARECISAFGEGFAVLAAAGRPDVDPHAGSDSATRARWDRDVAHFSPDLLRVQRFLLDVSDERVTGDSLQQLGMSFFGVQGPWYTVGWRMAATIERVYGRQRLITTECDPAALLDTYNTAAREWNRTRGDSLATWSPDLVARLAPR
jgi:hypothetical protein